jgi:hypothetical protein
MTHGGVGRKCGVGHTACEAVVLEKLVPVIFGETQVEAMNECLPIFWEIPD